MARIHETRWYRRNRDKLYRAYLDSGLQPVMCLEDFVRLRYTDYRAEKPSGRRHKSSRLH